MTDFDETRRRRRKANAPARDKPKVKRIAFTCPDINCNHFCIVEAPINWTGVHTCSKCGTAMKEA